MRKTKVICTLGPATDDEAVLRELMLSGMDGARFNFSHQEHSAHQKRFETVSRMRREMGLYVATILDTRGPEIRLGKFAAGKVTLEKGATFVLTTRDVPGDASIASITYADLPRDIRPGATVLIDDGLVEMTVSDVTDTDIVCKVKNTGVVSNSKGINVPGTRLSMPFISKRDRDDIIFGIHTGFDFIAASFTRSAEDILELRRLLDEYDCNTINIIAKIENADGVRNIDEILRVADGIMVARGDMGVEIPLEDVPVMQKMMIRKAYMQGKQVITATQMLDSMMNNPRPTRAEAADVANAIYDGTSAIMLSGETAAGKYPVEALRTMVRIATRAEQAMDYRKAFYARQMDDSTDVTNAISHATCTTAHDLGAAAIVTVTKSGKTARMISKYRPGCDIIGCSTSAHVCRQLNMSWGVRPLIIQERTETDALFEHAVDSAEAAGYLKSGELVVVTAGIPLGMSGTTNMLKVHVAGHILASGVGVGEGGVCGRLCVCQTEEEVAQTFHAGDILVVHHTTNAMMPLLRQAQAIVAEEAGLNSHAAITGMALGLPVLIGVANATCVLHSGAVVQVDAMRGVVASAGCPAAEEEKAK
ncbi:MAG: pyruvate kinase [Eubacteriales bacterium]|nr:pyruvate kinase [Eubacteriales bacterium]